MADVKKINGYDIVDAKAIKAVDIAPVDPTPTIDADTLEGHNTAYFEAMCNGVIPCGSIQLYGGLTAPTGWMLCQGQSLSRTDYSKLFAVIGTTFGSDSSTTFNLPDLQGRVAVGVNNGDADFGLGTTGGEKKHTLTTSEMPAHTHTVTDAHPKASSGASGSAIYGSSTTDTRITSSVGGDASHNNLQPYIALSYIIKVS